MGDLIRGRKLTVEAAQAQLNAQLTTNKFADATFANRVKAIDLSTKEGRLQLDQLQRDYQRDPTKYALELRDLQARVAVSETDAKIKAATYLNADGSGVSDRKGMRDTLTRMQIGVAASTRQALSSYKLVVDKIFPNAKIAVDRYDPKNFAVLTRSKSDLTPDEQTELQAAAANLSTATGMQKDLITALGQNQVKGRIDPKLAQTLGIYDPGEQTTSPAVQFVPGADLTKAGFTKDALYNDKDAKGKPISFCVRFARQYEEQKAGVPAFSLGKYFKGNATETLQAFATQKALYVTNVTPKAALGQAGQLKEGDLLFLNYGDSNIDHTAVYDGKGGVIQHSLPSFRGQTIQGAVNTMSLEQFLGRAGKATVSFGRIPSSADKKKDVPSAAPSTPAPTQTPPITAPPGTPTPAPSSAAKPAPIPKLGDIQFDAKDLGLMKSAVQSILGEKDPAKQLAKGTQIAGSLAAQLSTRYNTRITPASMTLWLQQNGMALK